jgi:hypothetical protein
MAAQAVGHPLEQGVADEVPVRVVDDLEAVEVDEEQAGLRALAPGRR